MTKTVLVTGASGFLGTPVVQKLRKAGFHVISTDRVGDPDVKGDLAERDFTSSLPDVDIVVHCAAVQYVTPEIPLLFRKRWFERDNITATQNLVDRYRGDVEYYLQIGTSMMYDQSGLSEYRVDSPLKGVGVYSKSKLKAVQIAETIDAPLGVMVPCIIGGKGREGLFRIFVKTIAKFRTVVIPGQGTHQTHMVHVDDAADLVVRLVEQEATGYYNAAGPDPLSIEQWVAVIQRTLGIKHIRKIRIPYPIIALAGHLSRYRLIAKEQALMLGQSHVLSTKESQEIGWKPQHSNEKIVADIAQYMTE